MYQWILLGHVIGAAVLFGGHVYMEGMMASAARDDDRATYMTTMLKTAATADRLMGPASLITLVFGIWLVFDSASWDFSQLFVSIGFAVIIAAFAVSMFLMRPRSNDIKAAIAENGITDDKAMADMKALGNLAHVQTLLVTIALVVMVVKPGI
jgi:uncharacterized membrane protein